MWNRSFAETGPDNAASPRIWTISYSMISTKEKSVHLLVQHWESAMDSILAKKIIGIGSWLYIILVNNWLFLKQIRISDHFCSGPDGGQFDHVTVYKDDGINVRCKFSKFLDSGDFEVGQECGPLWLPKQVRINMIFNIMPQFRIVIVK